MQKTLIQQSADLPRACAAGLFIFLVVAVDARADDLPKADREPSALFEPESAVQALLAPPRSNASALVDDVVPAVLDPASAEPKQAVAAAGVESGGKVVRIDRSAETVVPDEEVAARITAIVRDAKVDPRLAVVAAARDREAATLLESRLAQAGADARASLASRKEAYGVLRKDFHRPWMHLLALESFAEELRQGPASDYVLELAYQEAEYLRQSTPDGEILARSEAIFETLPPRNFSATREFLERAAETFAAGGAFYIEYDSAQALRIEVGAEEGLKRFRIPVRYVRSPGFPPRGCQVVTTLVELDAETQDSSRTAVLCASDYLPCAYPAGKLEGEYVTLDRIDLRPGTRLLAYVATASADERIAGVPLSNSIAIPILAAEQTPDDAGIPEDDPFRDPDPTDSDVPSKEEPADPPASEGSDGSSAGESADAAP